MTSEQLVQGQLDSYNKRDVEAFVKFFSPEIEVFNFPGLVLRSRGLEKFRETYKTFFNETPDLHCHLVNRIIQGSTIIDQEIVTGFSDQSKIEAIAIYKIEDELISKVWFIR